MGAAHFDLNRVKELVEERPALANATWDWGFGDFESALGAASHVGRREIAEYLISKGARPSIFSAAMLGQLEVVKAFVVASPGVQRITGPHSISLLAHARVGGAAAEPVLKYLESLGDAAGKATAALTDAEATALAGSYVFGTGPADKLEIGWEKNLLTITRPGASARVLRHVGGHVFYPSGAMAVRIQIADGVLTVKDGTLLVTAKRAG